MTAAKTKSNPWKNKKHAVADLLSLVQLLDHILVSLNDCTLATYTKTDKVVRPGHDKGGRDKDPLLRSSDFDKSPILNIYCYYSFLTALSRRFFIRSTDLNLERVYIIFLSHYLSTFICISCMSKKCLNQKR